MGPITRRASALLLLFLTAAAPAGQGQDAVRGAPSCGEWVAMRKKGETLALANASWLIGYLSGLGEASGRDAFAGRDNAAAFAWMDKYCREHPLTDAAAGGRLLLEAGGRKAGPK